MGANNSRNGGDVLPARIRQRIEELRNRKNGATLQTGEEGTSSNKKLWNDGVKSQSSQQNESEHNKGSLNDIQSTKHVEKLSKVVPLYVSEPRTQEQHNVLHNEEKWKDVQNKGEVVDEDEEDDDDEYDEDEDDDYDIQNQNERRICPGSPSFKIYCNEKDIKNNEEGHKNRTVPVLQTSPSVESFNEVVEIESAAAPKRKGSKKKKLGAMKKNLLQVKHLNMNRMKPILACTAGSDRRKLYEGK